MEASKIAKAGLELFKVAGKEIGQGVGKGLEKAGDAIGGIWGNTAKGAGKILG